MNGQSDLYRLDLQTDTFQIVAPRQNTDTNNIGFVRVLGVSSDGNIVHFNSNYDDIVIDQVLGTANTLYFRDINAGTTVSQGRADDSGVISRMTPDGRFVAFESGSSSYPANPSDFGGSTDQFLWDRLLDVFQQVNLDSQEMRLPGGNLESGIPSGDGRFVGMASTAANPDIGFVGGYAVLYLRDTLEGLTYLISRNREGEILNDTSLSRSPSLDGAWIGFFTEATNIEENDMVVDFQVYIVRNPAL